MLSVLDECKYWNECNGIIFFALNVCREAWGMRMDAARNEIILVNLKMTLISLCLMICVVSVHSPQPFLSVHAKRN